MAVQRQERSPNQKMHEAKRKTDCFMRLVWTSKRKENGLFHVAGVDELRAAGAFADWVHISVEDSFDLALVLGARSYEGVAAGKRCQHGWPD